MRAERLALSVELGSRDGNGIRVRPYVVVSVGVRSLSMVLTSSDCDGGRYHCACVFMVFKMATV